MNFHSACNVHTELSFCSATLSIADVCNAGGMTEHWTESSFGTARQGNQWIYWYFTILLHLADVLLLGVIAMDSRHCVGRMVIVDRILD